MKTFLWSLCIGFVTLTRAADMPDRGAPLPPHADFRPVRSSQLHLGMSAADVVHVMGDAQESTTFPDTDIRELTFTAETIPTKVVLTRDKVSSISLNVARLDEARLPAFARTALLGMSSMGVRDMLGDPCDIRHYEYYEVTLDQWIFECGDDPTISVFFVEDRVVTKTLGSAVPADIFRVVLPAPLGLAARSTAEDGAVPGASTSELQVLFGKPKLEVDYLFDGQPAAHALYQTRDHHTLSVYFLGGVLIEITDIGTWSIDDTPSG